MGLVDAAAIPRQASGEIAEVGSLFETARRAMNTMFDFGKRAMNLNGTDFNSKDYQKSFAMSLYTSQVINQDQFDALSSDIEAGKNPLAINYNDFIQGKTSFQVNGHTISHGDVGDQQVAPGQDSTRPVQKEVSGWVTQNTTPTQINADVPATLLNAEEDVKVLQVAGGNKGLLAIASSPDNANQQQGVKDSQDTNWFGETRTYVQYVYKTEVQPMAQTTPTTTASADTIVVPSSTTAPSTSPTVATNLQKSTDVDVAKQDNAKGTVPENNDSTDDADNLPDWAKSLLSLTNQYRSKHSAGALQWDPKLAKYAEDYGNKVGCNMKHSGGEYGENLAIGMNLDAKETVDMWYNEKDEYNYSKPGFTHATGHFTALVWKKTTHMGCARHQCGNTNFFICEYSPAGNIVGDNNKFFVENVLPN